MIRNIHDTRSWDDLKGIPDVGNLDDSLLQKKLTADLPDDEDATGQNFAMLY